MPDLVRLGPTPLKSKVSYIFPLTTKFKRCFTFCTFSPKQKIVEEKKKRERKTLCSTFHDFKSNLLKKKKIKNTRRELAVSNSVNRRLISIFPFYVGEKCTIVVRKRSNIKKTENTLFRYSIIILLEIQRILGDTSKEFPAILYII